MEPERPLRILILLNRVPYPLNDGGAIGSFNFVKGYAEAGAEVTILAMNTTKHFVDEQTVQAHLGRYGTVHTVHMDNRIKPLDALLNLFTDSSYIISRFVSDAFTEKLKSLLRQQTFDVVHADGLPTCAYVDVIRAHSKAYISMRAHNVEHIIWQRIAANETNTIKRWYVGEQAKRLRVFEIDALRKVDLVLAISREDEQAIVNATAKPNTCIVPAGMDIAGVRLNENYNPLDVFFIGSFDWMPNLQGMDWFLNDVMPVLQQSLPDIHIHVAGKKMPERYRQVTYPQWVAVGEVPDAKEFMLQHGVMVVPIISGSGIRIKILEGMALGKCVIATTIAAEGLGLTHNENILIADTPDAFVQEFRKCMEQPGVAKQIGSNAYQFARNNYDNKTIFANLLNRYRQAI